VVDKLVAVRRMNNRGERSCGILHGTENKNIKCLEKKNYVNFISYHKNYDVIIRKNIHHIIIMNNEVQLFEIYTQKLLFNKIVLKNDIFKN
jgi:hypothetical protein